MRDIGLIKQAIGEFAECIQAGNHVAVPTQHLYPSNANVVVFVEFARVGEFCVTDRGRSVEELSALGLDVPNPDQLFRNICRQYGVESSHGVISSPLVPLEGLTSAIIFVATASARVVEHCMDRLKPERHRDLIPLVGNALEIRFPALKVKRDEPFLGASGRQYTFDFSLLLPTNKQLLVDVVTQEPSSINSKVVSHLDVSRNEDTAVVQRIVFDDEENWSTSDLSLLQMAAVTVPFSALDKSLIGVAKLRNG